MDIAVPPTTGCAQSFATPAPSCTAQTRLAERSGIGHNAPGLADALSKLRRILPYFLAPPVLPLHTSNVWHLPDGH
ncbi:hypothetical protein [Uliginosibacterium gangwonense]|uniref:hypothetical protein n=1 Tax=Uliginosibacterium gangwonense TaxID=392736 RepID=UPI0003A71A0E|nr:hypothetical protein [Uliginosibacterium gangwonense]